jgi:hypothetical protein
MEKIMHSWRANHDEAPTLVRDPILLKIHIQTMGLAFGLKGDVELDGGFSFSYQVQAFFPTYFQKQIAKSQFSLYDCFGSDADPNEIQKVTLSKMAKVDTNIFRDISTDKSAVPDELTLQFEFKKANLKIMRLKGCQSWLQYVSLRAKEPEWLTKQQAVISAASIDTLLSQAMSFIDMNDTATIARVIEDQATVHQETIARLSDEHRFLKEVRVTTADGTK